MKGTMIIGLASGMILGAAAAWTLTGDLNARGMNRISRNITKSARSMGIGR